MKLILICFLSLLLMLLISCKKDDIIAPDIFLYGDGGVILESEQSDTTVLLFSKFIDPGAGAEDNLTKTEDIIHENDLEDVLNVNDAGYINRAQTYEVIYKATDEAGNFDTVTRRIMVKNISDPFAGVYITERSAQQIEAETTYNSTVAADSRIPGRLSFPKVYSHIDTQESIYFKISADLFDPDISDEFSESIAYMGQSSDKETPFFEEMTYTEAVDQILNFDRLMISAQTFTDVLGNTYTISGVADPTNPDLPYSRIEYLSGTKTITKIYLELNVTKDGVYTDRVTETYTPQ